MRIANNNYFSMAIFNRALGKQKNFSEVLVDNHASVKEDNFALQTNFESKEIERKKDVLKTYFDDEELASHIGFVGKEEISTEKTINWQSTGMGELTSEQIDYLKSAYDIEHMNGQSYYNLMSDLSHMDILSGYDIMRQYVKFGVPGSSLIMEEELELRRQQQVNLPVEGQPGIYEVHNFFSDGNALEYVRKQYDSASRELDGAARAADCYINSLDYLDNQDNLKSQQSTYRKLYEIFNLINMG